MSRNDYVEFEMELTAKTTLSFLVSDVTVEDWIPCSQMEEIPEAEVGEMVEFSIPEWLAIEKGFV